MNLVSHSQEQRLQVSQNTFNFSVPDWNQIPQLCVLDVELLEPLNVIRLNTTEGDLFLSMYKSGIRFYSNLDSVPEYQILASVPASLECKIKKENELTVVSQQAWRLEIHHNPFSFELSVNQKAVQRSPTDGHFVRRYRVPPLAKTAQGWLFSMDLSDSEPVYGLGEKWGRLDKRGQIVRSYNHDALGVNAEISYKNTPFAWSPSGWGIFVHTPAPVTHAVGYAPWSQRTYSVLVEDPHLDVFIFHGDSGVELIDHYTDLTGKAPMPPDWSMGVILSKAYYKDVDELLTTAKNVRANHMPCDVITLDGRAWQDTDTRFAFEWDPNRFTDPAIVINQLKDMNFKICVWEYPLVSVLNPLYQEMAKKGWLLTHKQTGEPYRYQWDQSAFGDVLTPLPESGIVDFTHPEAFEFWLESHKPLFDLGVDMIKADFGEQVEDDNMLAHSGDTGTRLHNVYSLLYNRCVYEAAKKYCKSGPFLFSRSAWAGSQRYPSQWGGDPQADWGGLVGSLRGALSWGMSGAPFYATDVGGFYKDTRDPELFVRWTQMAVFSAHMRLHGIGQREPWSYGANAEDAASKALVLRYKLLPYIKQALAQSTQTGVPVMRSMALAFPEDRAAWAFEQQFMFGDELLVAPCTQAGGEVEFYLPEGDWVQFPGKSQLKGSRVVKLLLNLDEIAVFARKGTSILLGPEVEHTENLNDSTNKTEVWVASDE